MSEHSGPFPFVTPGLVLVRAVSASFERCLRTGPSAPSPGTAGEQHAAYVATVASTGAPVLHVPVDDGAPDCCFIEDTCVMLGRSVLITCPGAPGRRVEVEPVAQVLEGRYVLQRMELPAILDGGDVLRAGDTLFVGLSNRTNVLGADRLESLARREGLRVVRIPVAASLHLKSVCSLAGPTTLVYSPGAVDPAPFLVAGLECLAVQETFGANVLILGDQVLVSEAAPRTAELLTGRGMTVRMVKVDEFHKADGALTCLSVRLPPPSGGWVT